MCVWGGGLKWDFCGSGVRSIKIVFCVSLWYLSDWLKFLVIHFILRVPRGGTWVKILTISNFLEKIKAGNVAESGAKIFSFRNMKNYLTAWKLALAFTNNATKFQENWFMYMFSSYYIFLTLNALTHKNAFVQLRLIQPFKTLQVDSSR